jgi:cell wall-associated NlpC family hydrolase
MPGNGGVSGTAVGLATAGGLLLFAGIKGVGIPDALRQVLATGTLPAGISPPSGGTAAGGVLSSTGNAIADAHLRHVGAPYRWAGADPSGWDCSGFPSYVLHHDLGYELPSDYHTVCMQFLVWKGAVRIAAAEPGALVVWPTHMGVAIDGTRMVSAVNPRRGTVVDTFAGAGPVPYTPPTFLRITATPGVKA